LISTGLFTGEALGAGGEGLNWCGGSFERRVRLRRSVASQLFFWPVAGIGCARAVWPAGLHLQALPSALAGTWLTRGCARPSRLSLLVEEAAYWCLSPRLHGPEPKLRPDKSPVNVPSLYRPLRRVMWITSVFQLCTGRYAIFPGGRLDKGIRRYRRPQHFSACPQACCLFAHVMHRFMHRKARQQDSYRARRRPAELRRRLYDIAAASS
jgi:hypothetical protein